MLYNKEVEAYKEKEYWSEVLLGFFCTREKKDALHFLNCREGVMILVKRRPEKWKKTKYFK